MTATAVNFRPADQQMAMDDILRLIASKSTVTAPLAIRAIRAARLRIDTKLVQSVLEQALGDLHATFTPSERDTIANMLVEDEETRILFVRFRVNAIERSEIQRLADDAGMNMSEFIRSKIGLVDA